MPFGKHLRDSRDLMILKRYQNTFMHKRRSVAEHMCATAMTAQWLVILENELFGGNVDMAEVLQRAINHNIGQCVTGNILLTPRTLSKSMDNSLKAVKELAYDNYIDPNIPSFCKEDFKRWSLYGKDKSKEGQILVAADIIDTMLECIEEINLGNRHPFERILKETSLKLIDTELDSVKYVLKYLLNTFGFDIRKSTSRKVIGTLFSPFGYNASIYPKEVKKVIKNISFDKSKEELLSYQRIGSYIYEYRNLMELLRYQNKFMHKRTSVVEHMWFVAKTAHVLALLIKEKYNIDVDIANVLLRALNHDVSERITGDILSTTKRMTAEMKIAVDEMEERAFSEYIAETIPSSVFKEFEQYILHPKDDTVEGRILSAADIIDTIFECADEIKLGNTEVFNHVLQRVSESLINVKLESLDYFLKNCLVDVGLDINTAYGEKFAAHLKTLN